MAPTAVVVGAVTMGPRSSIWYGAVARADAETIEIGEGSNVQDGCTLHSDAGFPLVIGSGVTVGHRVVLHGARVDDDVLVGMGSIVMNGAHIGSGSIVAAGAVVTQGKRDPAGLGRRRRPREGGAARRPTTTCRTSAATPRATPTGSRPRARCGPWSAVRCRRPARCPATT